MVKKEKSYSPSYDTDSAAKRIWLHLARDFRAYEGDSFARSAELAILRGIPNFRKYQFPEIGIISPSRFKAYAQLKGLLKKYRFQDDLYTDSQLEAMTFDKFVEEQKFFSTHRGLSLLGGRVLQRARKIARRILGPYNPEATVILGRFGRKSSIGCPLSLAYIDHKLTDAKAFTGSSECAKWFFNDVLPEDQLLKELVAGMGIQSNTGELLAHESLNLVNVPKSWKISRPITPLTLLALFYSYGVGEQVTLRLKAEGLDLSKLQDRHRRMIKDYSLYPAPANRRRYATADLSSASQSLVSWLLNRTLPREWYTAIKKTFSHQLQYKNTEGEVVNLYTESVLPMGNGLTFPVETLVFYIVLKAMAELAEVKGVISVYGDDLIYPSKLHKYVCRFFPEFGFILNLDKTFVEAPFRESCGADFYRGVDVRPFFLPDGGNSLTRTKYCVWLYQVYNGLVRRWDPLQIRSTLYFLLKELAMTGMTLFRVPPCFPDTAGIKVDDPGVIPLDTALLPWAGVCTLMHAGSRWYQFSYLLEQPDKRAVVTVKPYYWLALQDRSDDIPFGNFWDTDYSTLYAHSAKPGITWRKQKQKRSYRDKKGAVHTKVVVKHIAECSVKNFTRCTMATTPDIVLPGKPGEMGPTSDWI